MLNLVENEVIKIVYKKRLLIIMGILLVLISLFAYGENYTLNKTKNEVAKKFGIENAADWRKLSEQQLKDIERRLENPYMPEESKASLMVRKEQLQFHLDKNINPVNESSGRFTTKFMEQAVFLFLPLLIILLAGDIVSSETTSGTVKILLTKPVPRWRILLSKLLALTLLEMVVVLLIALLSFVISLLFFKYSGWDRPVITGFSVANGKLDVSHVRNIPQWQYTIMIYSLGYFISFVIGCLSLMVSVLVRSTSASIGIMMSTLIGGNFLSFFISDWKLTRYLFNVNLRLTDYLSGNFQAVEGLSLAFSSSVLAIWALGALFVSFWTFTRQDILA
ncbi:MAG: ABC transporter permease [Clostridia bacterium]|nr:ABC transporter permease [Clostridia bacterium]